MKWVLAIGFVLPILAAGAVVPAGAEVEVRLTTKLASDSSKVGDAVEATVIRPVIVDGQILIAAGSTVRGKVTEVKPVAKAEDRAQVGVAFQELAAPGAKAVKLAAVLKKVDNARETVDDKGRVVGILASETMSSRMDQGISRVAERYKGLADLLGATKGAIVKQSNAEIDYEPGVEMTLRLTSDLTATPVEGGPAVAGVPDEDALTKLVLGQPFRSQAASPPKPSDMTNLMYIGSQEQVEAAFRAAGWSPAAALSHQTALETFRAVAEMRGYKEAPMSILILDGQKPALVFQKQNNTFAMRHHLRVWARPSTYQGKPVWVCAATHDIGIDFSAENRTFIHKIDSNIDAERAKVVSDLLLTGKVKGLSLVERPDVPKQSQNATGDNLVTDGAMAVLLFE